MYTLTHQLHAYLQIYIPFNSLYSQSKVIRSCTTKLRISLINMKWFFDNPYIKEEVPLLSSTYRSQKRDMQYVCNCVLYRLKLELMNNLSSVFFPIAGAEDSSSKKFRDFLQEWPTPGTGPYFDTNINSNITGLVGKTVLLHCRVKNLGNRTVSIL